VKTFFLKLMGISSAVWNFYAPLLRSVFVSTASALLPLALDIVRSLVSLDTTGAAKREMAVKRLTDEAVALGIGATESLIRFTVESAVQRVKAND
jgi:hypothetical protein